MEREAGLKAWLGGTKQKLEQRKEESRVPFDKRRLAVLPFANMSPDPSDEYFADGITEEMISTISQIHGMSVIARTSVMSYKGSPKRISEIASELQVGSVLEGSVRKSGDRLRITTQLIDCETSGHMWAENYDRELRDVIAIQSEVAQRVAESLKGKLLSTDRKIIEGRQIDNPEAYTFYLQARHHFRKFTEEGLKKSEELYRKAMAQDPEFALAYEGLASTYAMYALLQILPEKVAHPKAREYSEKALELNESLSESHYILGRTLLEYYWAFSAGESELRRSIELNPNNGTVRLAYAWLLASRLDREGAMMQAQTAVQLDPKSSETWFSASFAFYLIGDYEKAIDCSRKAIEVNPLDPVAHHLLSIGLLYSGKIDEAIKEMREAVALGNNHVLYRANLAFVYGFAGRPEEARKIIDEMKEISKTEHVSALLFAWAYSGLNEPDAFFYWWEKAYEEHSSFMIYELNDPWTFKSGLHSDPRFKAIMEKVGLDTRDYF